VCNICRCERQPVFGFDSSTECCNRITDAQAPRDDGDPCTIDTCTEQDSRGVPVHTDINAIACGGALPPCPLDPDGVLYECVSGYCFCTSTPNLGACCDREAFGECGDGVLRSECACDKCVWLKDEVCADIECTHLSIPTVSQWGLVVLTLLLLSGAKVFFRRRPLAGSGH